MNFKKIGRILTSKFVGTGPSSYEKRIYWAAVSRRLRNTGIYNSSHSMSSWKALDFAFTTRRTYIRLARRGKFIFCFLLGLQ